VGEAMAGGGIIAFAGGDTVKDPDLSATTFDRLVAEKEAADVANTTSSASGIDSLIAPPPTRLPAYGAEPAVNPATSVYGGIPTMSPESKEAFSQYANLYKDLRSDTPKAREEAKWMAIMQAGLGIAGGTSPNALANISQGAQPAMAQYQAAIKDIRKEDREALKGLVDLGLKKEEFIQRAEKMGIDKYTADKVFEAHKYSADMQLKAAQARAAAEKQPKSITEGDITAEQINNGTQVLMRANPNMSKEEARYRVYQDILAAKRPLAPSAAVPAAITGATKASDDLKALKLELLTADTPAEKEAIQKQIDIKKKEIAAEVKTGSSEGRGITSTVVPNLSAPAGANPAETTQPLPMPKTQGELKINGVYNTTRGPAKWDGKQFIPVK
jgi:hypothetical protein